MSFTKFVLVLFLAVFCVQSNAVKTCNFDFMIPGIGPNCEAKGGLSSDLIDKYEELFGGVEGLKFVVDDKKGLRKLAQDAFSRLQREQQIYAQNIKQIGNDIQAVKNMLGIFPIGPPVNEDDDSADQIVKRAVDPYNALRAALQLAEVKLANMSRNMQEAARRQSMSYSTIEQRIQQQDIRLQSTLMRIGLLEKRAKVLPGAPQPQGGGISSSTFNAIMNIASISAKIQSVSAIIQVRVQDLRDRLQELDKPIQKRNHTFQALNNDVNRLNTGVSKLSTDAASFSTDMNKYKNKLTQDVAPLQADMRQNKQKIKKLVADTAFLLSKIQNDTSAITDNGRILKLAEDELAQLNKNLTSTITPQITNITTETTTVKQDPLYQLGHELSSEAASVLKLQKDVAQASKLANNVKALITMQGKRISVITASG